MTERQIVGLIPAAGKGLRLRLPYPKELYPVIHDNRYKPIAQFILENLTESNVDHSVFVVNETKHQLIGYFGDGSRFDCHISYVVQETAENGRRSTSPGLAHALDAAYHLTQGKTVCFGMADTIIKPDNVFQQLMHESFAGDDVVLGVFPSRHPEKGAMVKWGEDGTVLEIVDKPVQTEHGHTWGCMVWHEAFTEHLHHCIAHEIVDFADVLNAGIRAGLRFAAHYFEGGSYTDLGTYDEILEMERRHSFFEEALA